MEGSFICASKYVAITCMRYLHGDRLLAILKEYVRKEQPLSPQDPAKL